MQKLRISAGSVQFGCATVLRSQGWVRVVCAEVAPLRLRWRRPAAEGGGTTTDARHLSSSHGAGAVLTGWGRDGCGSMGASAGPVSRLCDLGPGTGDAGSRTERVHGKADTGRERVAYG
ncbi:hypothetical protein GCM10009642_32990 [Nocardiopsis metallicus]